ncbi:MAG: glycine cleavage T C-terminal barrel domain-containing protein [Acidimicrobiales bacterium]
MLDLDATLHAFTHAVAGVVTERDVVEAVGPDAASFLQGQLSQEIENLAVGASVPALLLQPQGKVDAWLRVSRLEPERFWLDVDAGYGAAVAERLNRFKIRVKVELTLLERQPVLTVRGPGADGGPSAVGLDPGDAVVLAVPAEQARGAGPGFDLVGAVPDDGPVPLGPPAAREAWRIRWGLPAMGRELDESTIPAAAGIVEESVNFTKGCYVGQELVARIDSRGASTPTRLRGLRLAEPLDLTGGEVVEADGADVGRVTSYAPVTGEGPLALAYCRRALDVPAPVVVVDAAGHRVAAEAVELPF